MNEEYLWDKTGEDAEIEKLENALRAFRYKENAPPALPAKIVPFTKQAEKALPQKRGNFRFAFALAACAAFVFFGLSVWTRISSEKFETAKTGSSEIKAETPREMQNNQEIQENIVSISETNKIDSPKKSVQPKAVKIKAVAAPKTRSSKLVAKNSEAKKPPVKLTEEEQYAYDQLMLALSITSSKLKIVKDKVEGIEQRTALVSDGK
jgi:hypothetical protein